MKHYKFSLDRKIIKIYLAGFLVIPLSFFLLGVLFTLPLQLMGANINPDLIGKGAILERSFSNPFVCGNYISGIGDGPTYQSYCGLIEYGGGIINQIDSTIIFLLQWYLIFGLIFLPLILFFKRKKN